MGCFERPACPVQHGLHVLLAANWRLHTLMLSFIRKRLLQSVELLGVSQFSVDPSSPTNLERCRVYCLLVPAELAFVCALRTVMVQLVVVGEAERIDETVDAALLFVVDQHRPEHGVLMAALVTTEHRMDVHWKSGLDQF